MVDDERFVALIETDAIRTQIVRFARYLDERRWDEYSALFTEDGTLELPFGSWSGPTVIRDHVEADFAKYTATQHINSNYDIKLDGDTANVRATFVATHVTESDGTASWRGGGAYHLVLRQIAGAWRIKRLTIEPIWRYEMH